MSEATAVMSDLEAVAQHAHALREAMLTDAVLRHRHPITNEVAAANLNEYLCAEAPNALGLTRAQVLAAGMLADNPEGYAEVLRMAGGPIGPLQRLIEAAPTHYRLGPDREWPWFPASQLFGNCDIRWLAGLLGVDVVPELVQREVSNRLGDLHETLQRQAIHKEELALAQWKLELQYPQRIKDLGAKARAAAEAEFQQRKAAVQAEVEAQYGVKPRKKGK